MLWQYTYLANFIALKREHFSDREREEIQTTRSFYTYGNFKYTHLKQAVSMTLLSHISYISVTTPSFLCACISF